MSIKARFQFNYPQAKQSEAFNFDVDITLPATGISVIYGPSGCGKTTLLRCIAGLHKTTFGQLEVVGEVWQSDKHNRPTHQRSLAYVFQEASLFSHLSADKNLQYAIDRALKSATTISKQQVVDLMALTPLLGKLPAELSGGEQQRVAIARALLTQAKLILMDEPLSALDNQRKDEILPYLERLRSTFDLPIIYVTHSMQELTRLADYVVLMNNGHVTKHGPVTALLSDLENNDQFGDETSVVLMAKVTEKDEIDHLVKVELSGESIWLQDNGEMLGQKIRLRILAKDISLTLAAHDDTSILNRIPVTIDVIKPARNGASSWLSLTLDRSQERTTLIASITQRSLKHLNLKVGTKAWAQIKSVALLSAYHD